MDWAVKVRVVKKHDVRTFKNSRGEGRVLSLDLLDEEGTEIMGSVFGKAIDVHCESLEEGKVYILSGGLIKLAAKRFTSIKNDYMLELTMCSRVLPVEDDLSIKPLVADFVPLSRISNLSSESIIDILAVVKKVGELMEVNSKITQRSTKRVVILYDNTNTQVELHLWRALSTIEMREGQIVAGKSIRVYDYAGRQLTSTEHSSLFINPNHEQTRVLTAWLATHPNISAWMLTGTFTFT